MPFHGLIQVKIWQYVTLLTGNFFLNRYQLNYSTLLCIIRCVRLNSGKKTLSKLPFVE